MLIIKSYDVIRYLNYFFTFFFILSNLDEVLTFFLLQLNDGCVDNFLFSLLSLYLNLLSDVVGFIFLDDRLGVPKLLVLEFSSSISLGLICSLFSVIIRFTLTRTHKLV